MISAWPPPIKRWLSLATVCLLAAALRAEEVAPIAEEAAPIGSVAGDGAGTPPPSFAPGLEANDPDLIATWEDIEAGRIRHARRRLNHYLDTKPRSAPAWTLLGHSYAAKEDWSDAFGKYKKALKFDPHYAPAYFGKGQVFEKKGRLDEAVNEYRAATLCDPLWAPARDALARLAVNAAIPD